MNVVQERPIAPTKKVRIKAINYDSHNDILRLYFDVPDYSFCYEEETSDALFLSHSIDDDSLCGAMVFNYAHRNKDILEANYPFIPWDAIDLDCSKGSFVRGKYLTR